MFVSLTCRVALLVLVVWWVLSTTDPEWRALETLQFKRDEPRPAWHEVEERFRTLSSWYLEHKPRPWIRAQRRAAQAYRYLQAIYQKETQWERQLAEWLHAMLITTKKTKRPQGAA